MIRQVPQSRSNNFVARDSVFVTPNLEVMAAATRKKGTPAILNCACLGGTFMSEKLEEVQEVKVQRPKRVKLTAEESLKRMEAFPERKEQIVAAVRKSKDRGVPS